MLDLCKDDFLSKLDKRILYVVRSNSVNYQPDKVLKCKQFVQSLRVYHSGFYSHSHSDPCKFPLYFTDKNQILIEDLSKYPVCKHITADTEITECYSACAEGKNQWTISRVTMTVKATEVNAQSLYCQLLDLAVKLYMQLS